MKVDLTLNNFSDAELHGLKARIEDTFLPTSPARERFQFDAPTEIPPAAASRAGAIPLCSVAEIGTSEAAKAVIANWKAAGVSHAELVALRKDLEGFFLQVGGILTPEEFDQRYVEGNLADRSSRAFFDAGSSLTNRALLTRFAILRGKLPQQ